jgi:hypothetical protein
MNKIFGIGLHRTGTSSLGLALQQLGYRTHANADARSRTEARRMAWNVCSKYDALQDVPWPVLYRWLDDEYPNSKFILTVRPEEDWIDSVCRTFGGKDIEAHAWIYDGVADPLEDPEHYLKTYRQHNQEVLDYFGERRGDDLLVMDVTKGDRWEKLCPFLGDPVPWLPFPRGKITEGWWRELDSTQQLKQVLVHYTRKAVIHYRHGRLLRRIRMKVTGQRRSADV